MAPAHQGLEAAENPRLGPALGLVVDHQLVVLHRIAQVAGQVPALAHRVVGVVFEEAEVLPTGRLGPLQGGVGIDQQGVHVGPVVREQADPHAGPVDRAADLVLQGLQPLGEAKGRVLFGNEDHQHELVAAIARDKGRIMEVVGEALAQLRQDRVPGRLPVQVVHVLEAVEIGADHGELLPRPPGPVHARGETRMHGFAVGQAGQAVVLRQIVDPAFRGALLAQVAKGDDEVVGTARGPRLVGEP